jgi:two-component system response regulator (stage 0 sporulation protein A)
MPAEEEHLRRTLNASGFSNILCVHDGLSALRMVRDRRPDVVIADSVLPLCEGVELVARIHEAQLTVYPAMLLLTLPGMRLSEKRLQGCCGYAQLEKPVMSAALLEALDKTRPERRAFPERMRGRALQILHALGVPEHYGRDYLLTAILTAWQDERYLRALTDLMYPSIARLYGVDPRRVERGMRYVIDAAWRVGEIDAQYKLFGDTIDAKRGCPTCGEMIAQIADILRWEGRA